MVKDLLADNIDWHVIYFCDEAARIARPDTKDKHRHACLLFLLKQEIIAIMAYVTWVLVRVQYLIPYTKNYA